MKGKTIVEAFYHRADGKETQSDNVLKNPGSIDKAQGTPLVRICLDLTPKSAKELSDMMILGVKLHWGFRIITGETYLTTEPIDAGMWEHPVNLQGRETSSFKIHPDNLSPDPGLH